MKKKDKENEPIKEAAQLEKSGQFEKAQSIRDYIFYKNWLYLHI